MKRNCNYCRQEYSRRPSVIGKFCSNSCKGKGNLIQQKNLTYKIPKGSIPWNKGINNVLTKCKNCQKTIHTTASTKKRFCNKHCFDEYQTVDVPVKYGAIHRWVRRKYGDNMQCENCGTNKSKKFEWANISGLYKLQREDWARLCCKCHRRYDLGTKNRIEVLNV